MDGALRCDQADDAFGQMGVEIVAHHAPLAGRCGLEQGGEEGGEIVLGPGIADCADHSAGRDIERGDERLRAMADVFELTPLDPARLHR